MYVILERNGYTFASDGMYYVILHHGVEIMRDMHKLNVERQFMQLSKRS